MSEFFSNLDYHAEKDRQQHQDEVALRIIAQPLPWDVKVEKLAGGVGPIRDDFLSSAESMWDRRCRVRTGG